MKNGKYVVFDGVDGSGKSSQVRLLEKKFGPSAIYTHEPGGTPLAAKIREILIDDVFGGQMTTLTRFLLFWAAREELQYGLIAPALRAGKHVFSDRSDSSTFAYQLCAEGYQELIEIFLLMRKLVFHGNPERRSPDLYIILDLPPKVADKRMVRDAARTMTHFDKQVLEYHCRVRDGFQKFSTHAPVEIVNANQTPEEIHQDILQILAEKVGLS